MDNLSLFSMYLLLQLLLFLAQANSSKFPLLKLLADKVCKVNGYLSISGKIEFISLICLKENSVCSGSYQLRPMVVLSIVLNILQTWIYLLIVSSVNTIFQYKYKSFFRDDIIIEFSDERGPIIKFRNLNFGPVHGQQMYDFAAQI